MKGRILLLFSLGLDSLLSAKLLQEQGFEVLGVHFVTPFFGDPDSSRELGERYGVGVKPIDITGEFFKVLSSPRYGYGKGFNPCIDCKLLMFKKAKEMMEDVGCTFIASGEVVDQRPFSQRVKVFSLIEKELGLEGRILRPLSAKVLRKTVWEDMGLVLRDNLFGIRGRGRKVQFELAARFGIPVEGKLSPSGGCLLTDPVLSERFRTIFDELGIPERPLVEAVKNGRFFHLGKGCYLIVGRNRRENGILSSLFDRGFISVEVVGSPGPYSLLYGGELTKDVMVKVGRIVARYVKVSGSVTLCFRRFGVEGESFLTLGKED